MGNTPSNPEKLNNFKPDYATPEPLGKCEPWNCTKGTQSNPYEPGDGRFQSLPCYACYYQLSHTIEKCESVRLTCVDQVKKLNSKTDVGKAKIKDHEDKCNLWGRQCKDTITDISYFRDSLKK